MTDPRLKKLLVLDEGRRRQLYKCSAGFNTIGIGHNLDAKGISERIIDLIFEEDVAEAEISLDDKLPWWRAHDEVRRAALVDLTFNMGITRLLGFVNTLNAFKAQQYNLAAAGLRDSKWYGQVGNRGKRIVEMVATGQWPSEVL